MVRFLSLLVVMVAATVEGKKLKGCGIEFEIEGLCETALGLYFDKVEAADYCHKIGEATKFLPSYMRVPTAEEAQALMDRKCQEAKRKVFWYAVRRKLNPFKKREL